LRRIQNLKIINIVLIFKILDGSLAFLIDLG